MWQKAFDLPLNHADKKEPFLNKILLEFDSNFSEIARRERKPRIGGFGRPWRARGRENDAAPAGAGIAGPAISPDGTPPTVRHR
jgi:hypothetical protein